jgi:hypothetical protein
MAGRGLGTFDARMTGAIHVRKAFSPQKGHGGRRPGDALRADRVTGSRSPDVLVRREQRPARSEAVAASEAHPSITVTLFILTGVTGRSPAPVLVVSIFFTTSMPSMTFPNTGCLEAPGENQSRYELWTVLMKN